MKIETWGKEKASVAGRDSQVVAAMPGGRPLTSLVVGEAAGRVRERQLCAKKGGAGEREREKERVFKELHNTYKKAKLPPICSIPKNLGQLDTKIIFYYIQKF